ncbi:MAG: polyketide cyclase / dehydrase and lipid transport [Candidatus Nanopelagicaceae bacterium]|nr:polyketide cyclase / dehydrase and lipid transport [Candidatus Nanopelagicaceae bacterium]
MTLRAEILDTGNPKIKSASIIINAPASKIFDVIANPQMHSIIDGSYSVRSVIKGPKRLALGSKFGMNMEIGIKYRITNTVVEFEENKLIAWRHLGRWIWRYELKEISPTQTVVIESFDGTTTPLNLWLKVRKAYPYTQKAVAKTLVRLKEYCEAN